MGFSPNLKITKNLELLYPEGTILLCPLCGTEHYKVLRNIYKRDQVTASQVEALSDDIINPAIVVTQRCQSCMGGGAVPLVEKVAGREFKRG